MEIPRLKHLPGFGVIIFGLLTALAFARVAAAAPSFSNVFIVLEENRSYSQIVGSPLMPYLNMLINNNALATQYFANEHGSLPNYLWITSGSNDGVTIDSCFPTIFSDNAVLELNVAHVSWKTYQESLPSVGYLGCAAGEYAKRHDPFAYYDIVLDSSAQQQRPWPLSAQALIEGSGDPQRHTDRSSPPYAIRGEPASIDGIGRPIWGYFAAPCLVWGLGFF